MIVFVLPAYDEAGNISDLLDKIAKTMAQIERPYEVVVVDDGSTDETPAILKHKASEMPLTILTHPQNRGLGNAIRTGMLYAIEEMPHDSVVFAMDSDNSHDPKHSSSMLRALSEGADLAIASRFTPGGEEIGVKFHRLLMSRLARGVFTLLFRVPGVRDYTCSFRAYRMELLRRAREAYGDSLMTSEGFPIMAELLVKLAALGPTVAEVPLTLRYDLKKGRSKLAIARTMLDYAWMLFSAYPLVASVRRKESRLG